MGCKFSALVDTGSPITIFNIEQFKQIVGKEFVMKKQSEGRFVDFNRRPIQFVGRTKVDVQCGATKMNGAKVYLIEGEHKTIVGERLDSCFATEASAG